MDNFPLVGYTYIVERKSIIDIEIETSNRNGGIFYEKI